MIGGKIERISRAALRTVGTSRQQPEDWKENDYLQPDIEDSVATSKNRSRNKKKVLGGTGGDVYGSKTEGKAEKRRYRGPL